MDTNTLDKNIVLDQLFCDHSLEVTDASYEEYELWLGSFEGEDFKWKVIKRFNDFDIAHNSYRKFIDDNLKLNDKELREKWGSPRIDIELKKGKKLLNWIGVYSREVSKEDIKEDDEK